MYSSTWQNSSFSSNHDYNLVQPCPSIRFYLFLPKDLLFQSRERVSMAGAICNATTRRGQLARCSQMGRRCSALSLLWAGSLGSFPPPVPMSLRLRLGRQWRSGCRVEPAPAKRPEPRSRAGSRGRDGNLGFPFPPFFFKNHNFVSYS